jgi:hypothetical protein
MARIRILTAVSGADFQWRPGQVVDLPGEVASQWADGVRAAMVRDEPAEHAVRPAPQRATRKASPEHRGA